MTVACCYHKQVVVFQYRCADWNDLDASGVYTVYFLDALWIGDCGHSAVIQNSSKTQQSF